jgi:hypothetical protein
MAAQTSKQEAVRMALEKLGDVPPRELAAFIETNLGVALEPAIVTVLLGSLRESGALDLNQARAREAGERTEAEKAAKPAPRRRRRDAPRDDAPRTADSLTAPKACPACGGDYAFRGRRVVTGPDAAELVETKYRCKACEHEWRVRVPAATVGPLGAPRR